ncbi:MAG: hypothetical protein ABSB61_02275 [Anaerolineales bacterium]
MVQAQGIWDGNMSFVARSGTGFRLPLGTRAEVGGADDGFRPMELRALSLAAFTAMDGIPKRRKKPQVVSPFDAQVGA